MFESVRMIGALKMAYVVFPTMGAARTIYKVRFSHCLDTV